MKNNHSNLEKFYLSSKALYPILKEKGIKNLFHANTVSTSLTFINNRSLLSRSYVEKIGGIQTIQKSDNEDKEYNVWDDVFLDALDLHTKYSRPNKYGPVLFVMKLDLLLSQVVPFVLITKRNPWYWEETDNLEDRYYSDLDEVKRDYLSGEKLDSQIMFTFRSPDDKIKLNKFLDFIGVDKPKIFVNLKTGGQKNVGEYAFEKIETAMKANGLGHILVRHRHENNFLKHCNCNISYTVLFNKDFPEFEKRFKA